MEQTLFNIAVGVAGALATWVLKSMTKRIDDVEQAEDLMKNKLQAIELLVAGSYVKQSDLEKFGQAVFRKLDKLEDRLMTTRPLVVPVTQ